MRLCADAGLSFEAPAGEGRKRKRDNHAVNLVGLVQMTPGSVYSKLMELSIGMEAMHKYYFRPADCFSAKIQHAAALETPQRLIMMRRSQTSKLAHLADSLDDEVPVQIKGQIIIPADRLDLLAECRIAGKRCSLDHVMRMFEVPQQACRRLPALLLPEPLAYLVVRRRLAEVCLLSRWCHAFPWGDWPDATWKSENAGKHLPPQSPTVLDMAKIKQIASHIRKWVPAVLSIQDDDEEAREAEKLSFESCLTYLDGLQVAAAEATTGSCGSPCPGGNRAVAAFKP